jgi:hypothetical protein
VCARSSWHFFYDRVVDSRFANLVCRVSAVKQNPDEKMHTCSTSAEKYSITAGRAPLILPGRLPLQQVGELPVAALSLVRLRTDFRETAAWLPQLRAGTGGQVKASFKLPDSLTAYRLTALGLTKQTEIGSAKTSIRAALPLSVQVFLPRFAVENDRLLGVALVHNNTPAVKSCAPKPPASAQCSPAASIPCTRPRSAAKPAPPRSKWRSEA